jgi:hypothetical protein
MIADASSSHPLPDDRPYRLAEHRFREMPDAAFIAAPHAVLESFMELRVLVDADVHAIKRSLFAASLASRDDDKAASRWISAQHRRLARIGHRAAETFARLPGARVHAFGLLAPALHYMGEAVKGHIKETHFHTALHALMRIALASGRHHEQVQLDRRGRAARCTLTSLYFRALLLARLAGGGLTFAQIEILDAWMWTWMPALSGVDLAPEGVAYRADLDSNEGLRCGARTGTGPSLYLLRAPLEAVRLAISSEFQRGRTVCAGGDASNFAIADHFAALDAMRRNLRGVRHVSAGRGKRYPASAVVDLHVGLAEVMTTGFTEAAGLAQPLSLQPIAEAVPPRGSMTGREREHREGPRDAVRRVVQLIDVSDTGLSLEGEEADCAEVAVDDLVALRIGPAEPLLLAKVVRRLPAATGGRVLLGLLRLSCAAQPVRARRSSDAALPELSLLYIPGEDEAGRHDAYLTSDAGAAERALFDTAVGEDIFTFRFNRVRERGRGWVMAGFEVTAARRASPRTPPAPLVESHHYPVVT